LSHSERPAGGDSPRFGFPAVGRPHPEFAAEYRPGRIGYIFHRALAAIVRATDVLVERVAPGEPPVEILRRAFPDRCFSLDDIAKKYGVAVVRAGNLNSPVATAALAAAHADLGIVIGTRILKRSTFALPRLGSINLHKGAIPRYRGMPPGFWEIYNGEKSAEVTVHFVDDKLDTGAVVAASQLEISPLDNPDTLTEKLHLLGAEVLGSAVSALQSGTASPMPQTGTEWKANSKPSRRQVAELRSRLPHWRADRAPHRILKNLFALAVYYFGIYRFLKWLHERSGMRAAVILYHRVNDTAKDPLTTDLERFAGHMQMVARWYHPIATSALVDAVRKTKRTRPTSVAIHFDDCYRDVYLNACPILKACGVPGAAFVSSGFLDSSRLFAHDASKSPFRFENLLAEDLKDMHASGFELGAHTVTHADLGVSSVAEGAFEIEESVRQLERILAHKVTLFSYPFGGEKNVRAEFRKQVAEAGCACMFSAFGGIVDSETDAYAIPRFGASFQHRPLDLALEIEGLSPGAILARLRGRRGGADYPGRTTHGHRS
jgi:peptidoglycan/xylan/chitin deacetylase (PgdA/CDA1 family)/folate-dependent phosphoribosylglycinamide formyltransferase PurN